MGRHNWILSVCLWPHGSPHCWRYVSERSPESHKDSSLRLRRAGAGRGCSGKPNKSGQTEGWWGMPAITYAREGRNISCSRSVWAAQQDLVYFPIKKGVGGGETGQRQTRQEWFKVNVHIELLYWVFWRGRVAVGMTCFSVWDIIYCNGEGRIISSVTPDAWKTLLMSPGLLSS